MSLTADVLSSERPLDTGPAELGHLAIAARLVGAGARLPDIEPVFSADQNLSAVVVVDDGVPLGALTRWRCGALMSGRLGYGRALHARTRVGDLVELSRMVVPAEWDLVEASTAALGRSDADRHEDLVVVFADGSLGTVTVARLLAEVARAHAHQALHDALTGLANRRQFATALTRMLENGPIGVLYADVDDFKVVNDTHGHAVGDELLAAVAARLRCAVRPGDLIARLGGDEFAVLLEGMSSPDHVAPLADRVVSAFADPVALTGRRIQVSVSVGVAVGDRHQPADDLLQHADQAMYTAKRGGKGAYAVFETRARGSVVTRRELKSDLLGALRREELRLHYQPLVQLADGTISGAEALVRWQHPEQGLLAPGTFIGLAEENGLIVPLGRWVLE